uniref:Uncharacterized protein n=1 Tax=Prolemur simus TaxID=1328070 RepID=A0A8C8YH30_PROSS
MLKLRSPFCAKKAIVSKMMSQLLILGLYIALGTLKHLIELNVYLKFRLENIGETISKREKFIFYLGGVIQEFCSLHDLPLSKVYSSAKVAKFFLSKILLRDIADET